MDTLKYRMTEDTDALEVAHRHSIHNQTEIELSELCGCFYCLRIFHKNEIREWTDWASHSKPHPTHNLTAICPFCFVDSLIGDKSGFPLNKTFLEKMKNKWF